MQSSKFVVSGNIGAGKTTFIRWLALFLGIVVYEEEADNNPLLSLFYDNPEKWGFPMQIRMLRTRMETTRALLKTEKGCAQDRSVFEDGLFVKANYKQGTFHQLLFNEYNELFELLTRDLSYPDFFIYLRADPEECAKRIVKRGRECEKGIPLEYLKALHFEYEAFFEEKCKEVPVIVVDTAKLDVDAGDACYKNICDYVNFLSQKGELKSAIGNQIVYN